MHRGIGCNVQAEGQHVELTIARADQCHETNETIMADFRLRSTRYTLWPDYLAKERMWNCHKSLKNICNSAIPAAHAEDFTDGKSASLALTL